VRPYYSKFYFYRFKKIRRNRKSNELLIVQLHYEGPSNDQRTTFLQIAVYGNTYYDRDNNINTYIMLQKCVQKTRIFRFSVIFNDQIIRN
jgi:hypothetical protein